MTENAPGEAPQPAPPHADQSVRSRSEEREPSPPDRRPTLSTATAALLVALVALAASWNVLLNGFVWDDNQNILLNRWVREPERVLEAFLHHLGGYDPRLETSFYRPVMHLVFAGTYALAGLRPWAFHLVNLLGHAAMSAGVYLILVRWAERSAGGSSPRAQAAAPPAAIPAPVRAGPLLAALLFAVHPVHVQTVAWIAGIVDLSYSLLFVVAFLWATDERPGRLRPLLAAPVAFFLALLSKEPAVMLLPVVALAFALRGALSDPGRRRAAIARLGALSLAVAAYLPLRVNALGGLMRDTGAAAPRVGLEDGLASAVVLAGDYLRLLVWPAPLSALRGFELVPRLLDLRVLGALATLAAFSGIVLALRRRADAVLGAAVLVLPLLPALYVPVLSDSAGAERYAYLPSAGAALLLSSAVEALRSRWAAWPRAAVGALAAAAAAVLLAAAGATLAYDRAWRDDVTLWSDTIAKTPSAWKAHEALGTALLARGELGPAIASMERAIALHPANPDLRVNLASALVAAGRVDEGLAAAEQGVRALPDVAEAHAILGSALTAKGRFAEAAAAFDRAVSLNPSLAAVHNAAAIARAELGERERALWHLREAVRLQPENPVFVENLRTLAGAARAVSAPGGRSGTAR